MMPRETIPRKSAKTKAIKWIVIVLTAINFLLVLGFFVYLYFWVRTQ